MKVHLAGYNVDTTILNELQIQTGKLSEEEYVELVTQKIAEEKELAKQYMKQNDRKGATFALKRAKLMTTELEGE